MVGMTILQLISLSEEELAEAAGADRVHVIQRHQGRRRSDHGSNDEFSGSDNDEANGYDNPSGDLPRKCWIPSGGHKTSKSQMSVSIQTDDGDYVIEEVPAKFFTINVGILTGQARDIQLRQPVYLSEATRPGLRLRGTGSQTVFTGPDLFPIVAAVDLIVQEDTITVPRIKLNLWEPDYRRIEKQKKRKKLERDREWLERDASAVETDEEKERRTDEFQHKEASTELNPYCAELMYSLKGLFACQYLGRWPFTTKNENGIVRFEINKRSWQYVSFVATSIIHALITLTSMWNVSLFVSRANKDTATFLHQVESLDFDSYWHYLFWTYLMGCFVVVWNVILLMGDGVMLTDFMNRWNLGITQLRYVTKPSLRHHILESNWLCIFYAGAMTMLCFTKLLPAVHGTAGTLSVFALKKAFHRIRFFKYISLVRTLGLTYHLYTVYAAKSIILFITTYCKLIETAARTWNIRFALRFGVVGRSLTKPEAQPYRIKTFRTDISLQKLLREHRVITSFSRHTADVLTLIIKIYLFTKGMEVILFLYRTMEYFLVPSPDFSVAVEFQYEIGNTGERLDYKETEGGRMLTSLVVTFFVCFEWVFTSMSIVSCAEMIMNGYSVIRRYSIIMCQNAKERNFIQTIEFQLHPVREYCISRGFNFNKSFMFATCLWIVAFTLGILSLMPFNLQKKAIIFCAPPDPEGEVHCHTTYVSRLEEAASQVPKSPAKDPLLKIIHNCEGTTALNAEGKEISTEVLNILACEPQAKSKVAPYNPYNLAFCFKEFSHNIPDVPDETNSEPYSGYPNPLIHCITDKEIDRSQRDDCGNLPFVEKRFKHEVKLYFRKPGDTGKPVARFVCCYNFTGFPGDEKSLNHCHMQSPVQIYYACFKNSRDKPTGCSSNPKPTTTEPTVDKCNTEWRTQQETIKTEILTSQLVACDRDGNKVFPYETGQCASRSDEGPYKKQRETGLQLGRLRNCEDGSVINTVDDCGNIGFGGAKIRRFLMGIPQEELDWAMLPYCVDCFDYTQFGEENTKSLPYCHMQYEVQAKLACFTKGKAVQVATIANPVGSNCNPPNVGVTDTTRCQVDDKFRKLIDSQMTPAQAKVFKCMVCNNGGQPVKPYVSYACFAQIPSGEQPKDPHSDVTAEKMCDPSITGRKIQQMRRDDCKNLPYADGLKKKRIDLKIDHNSFMAVCCYDYFHVDGNEISIKFCHMESIDQVNSVCEGIRYGAADDKPDYKCDQGQISFMSDQPAA